MELPRLKCLQKTGASFLDDPFGRNHGLHYLAHNPRTVAERHYFTSPPKPKSDQTIAANRHGIWLLNYRFDHIFFGQRFGQRASFFFRSTRGLVSS
jgi:hypothetical protein